MNAGLLVADAAALGNGTNDVNPFITTNPAAVFVAPLAAVAGFARVLFGCLPVIFRDIDFAGQVGYVDPWHGFSSDGSVNSPISALRFIPRHCGVLSCTPHS